MVMYRFASSSFKFSSLMSDMASFFCCFYGHLAQDPKLATENFLKALEKIPKIIENHQRELEKVQREVTTYKSMLTGVWRKEPELKELKSELSELDRKIALSLKPIEENEEVPKEENGQGEKQREEIKKDNVATVAVATRKIR